MYLQREKQFMSVFEQWWLPIEAMIASKEPLSILQSIYKELYMNLIRDDRWAQYLNGLWVTLRVSFFAILAGTLLGTGLRAQGLQECIRMAQDSTIVALHKHLGNAC